MTEEVELDICTCSKNVGVFEGRWEFTSERREEKHRFSARIRSRWVSYQTSGRRGRRVPSV